MQNFVRPPAPTGVIAAFIDLDTFHLILFIPQYFDEALAEAARVVFIAGVAIVILASIHVQPQRQSRGLFHEIDQLRSAVGNGTNGLSGGFLENVGMAEANV